MYADKITGSMQGAIEETYRRRKIQQEYNIIHNITPKTVLKSKDAIMNQTRVADSNKIAKNYYVEPEEQNVAADPVVTYMTKDDLEKLMQKTQKAMEKAAKELDFIEAARLRDELMDLKRMHQSR
jgi:excinuclease ABC subunit B